MPPKPWMSHASRGGGSTWTVANRFGFFSMSILRRPIPIAPEDTMMTRWPWRRRRHDVSTITERFDKSGSWVCSSQIELVPRHQLPQNNFRTYPIWLQLSSNFWLSYFLPSFLLAMGKENDGAKTLDRPPNSLFCGPFSIGWVICNAPQFITEIWPSECHSRGW